MSTHVEFWFEFASTYSYLTIMRIDDLATDYGVEVEWKPFLLGPIFAAQGWNTSPFNIYPSKGRYMWRDMERQSVKYDLPFKRPDPDKKNAFPQNGLAAARMAMIGLKKPWGRAFCKSVFTAQFAEGRDTGDRAFVESLARQAGAEEQDIQLAYEDANKTALRSQTEQAVALGLFGAPSFIVDKELFWGDDRLDDAFAFAASLKV
ncbi:MAG: 2-hydroxychromene-2-carboxylate isomerase [Pseudomonadota bacterium]